MATTTAPALRLSALPPATGRAGLPGALRSEFTKLRSVRSTYWTLLALVVVSIGIGAAISAGSANQPHSPGDGFDATQVSLIAFFELGQLVIAVLGALTITSEYSTGMIRTSLTAMPRRGTVYAAKAAVFGAVALVVSLVTSFIAFFVGQAILHGTVHATLSQPHVLRAIVGSALFVTVVGLIAFGVGAIIRHSAGAITTVIGMMFIIPIIVQVLPQTWRYDLIRFLPDSAGRVISITVMPSGGEVYHMWSAWPQFAVTAVYAVVLLAIGAYLFRKRDA
jgi:ABC-type transport system involved in multi-copper enzyme maturation permease subunit